MTNHDGAAACIGILVCIGLGGAVIVPAHFFPDDPLRAGFAVVAILVVMLVCATLGVLALLSNDLQQHVTRQRQRDLAMTHRQSAGHIHDAGRTARQRIDAAEQQLYQDAFEIMQRRKR